MGGTYLVWEFTVFESTYSLRNTRMCQVYADDMVLKLSQTIVII